MNEINQVAITYKISQDKFGLFMTLLESINSIAFVIDTNGTILNANQTASKILGGFENGIQDLCIYDLLNEDQAILRKRDVEQCIRFRMPIHIEDQWNNRYFSHYLYPLCDEYNQVNSIFIIVLDITESERTKEALKVSEENYRSIVEHVRVGICTLNNIGKITYINHAFCNIIGYSEEKLLGKYFFELNIPSDAQEISTLFHHTLVNTRISPCIELKLIRSNNRPIPVEANFIAIKEDNKVVGFNVIVTDISKRKHVQSELHNYQKELRLLASKLSLAEEHERHRIAVEIHDNISQDMAICRMKLGALLQEAPPGEFVHILEEVILLHKQLMDRVRSLSFELSSPLLYEIGVEAAIEKLCEQIQKQYGIICHFEYNTRIVTLDEDIRILLFQIVRELLTNVVKHAKAHCARVSFNKHGDDLRIVVEDDGIGFDNSKCEINGINSGFGLFSIRERLGHIRGHMEIMLKRGGGTRVNLVVPLNKS